MKKNNIRPFSGPFDWVGTPQLKNVNLLIKDNLTDFLNLNNLVPSKYLSPNDLYVWDQRYDIGFNHDFKTDKNSFTSLGGFPDVKEKYNRRIKRFNDCLSSCENILFIRTEGEYGDVKELHTILTELVKHNFELLIVNHTSMPNMIELNWNLPHVTVVEMPNNEIWEGNDHHWRELLKDVHLKK